MDEVIRCYHCNRPQLRNDVYEAGHCLYCGSRKIRDAGLLTDEEMEGLIAKGFKPEEHGWSHEAVG